MSESYNDRISIGPYASHVYLSIADTEIFTLQLDYGCSDGTYIEIYHEKKWSRIQKITDLSDDVVKERFLLAAKKMINALDGSLDCSDRGVKAVADLKALLEN